ncbi:PEP-CTERM sorting domain-containing protein [Roseibacillus persicicus]|uniref:PEP-CTERM sorting domain-containing protein n=1 Tax=Roseibacillus persicicus TaxID=454148 RepID=UPI00398AA2FE
MKTTRSTLIQTAPFFFFFNTLINAQTIIVSEWHVPSGNPYTTGSAGSIVVGDGSMDSANSATFYGVFDEILLADGMTISLNADLTLAGGSIHSNQMRFGVYDSDGSSTDTGWLGYFSQNNLLRERNDPNTNSFASTGGTQTLGTGLEQNTFGNGNYDLAFSITRDGNLVDVLATLTGVGSTTYSSMRTVSGDTPNTFTFDRIGFLLGSSLGVDQATLSNVTINTVPEPSALAMSLLSLLTLLRRQRR